MQEQGRTLVIVPCWWKGDAHRYHQASYVIINLSSLIASIQFQRPDLLTEHQAFAPISVNIPPQFFLGTAFAMLMLEITSKPRL